MGRILILQTRDIMITNMDWKDASEEASEWLYLQYEKRKKLEEMYFFVSDSAPQPNNRITRYYGIQRREFIKKLLKNNCKIICEGIADKGSSLYFWGILLVNRESLSDIISYTRTERSSFLFFRFFNFYTNVSFRS